MGPHDRSSFPAEVLAVLGPATVRVVLARGDGQVDGGVHCDLEVNQVPETARFPGAKLWVDIDQHGNVRATRSRIDGKG
jgi:hypothetical protein